MNRMKKFNLVYKIKKEKTVKSGPVDRLLMTYVSIKKFLKLLPGCKSVYPLQRSYLKRVLYKRSLLFFFKCKNVIQIIRQASF